MNMNRHMYMNRDSFFIVRYREEMQDMNKQKHHSNTGLLQSAQAFMAVIAEGTKLLWMNVFFSFLVFLQSSLYLCQLSHSCAIPYAIFSATSWVVTSNHSHMSVPGIDYNLSVLITTVEVQITNHFADSDHFVICCHCSYALHYVCH